MEANKILLQSLYKKISNGIGDMHCRGVKYLTDELLIEYGIITAPKEK